MAAITVVSTAGQVLHITTPYTAGVKTYRLYVTDTPVSRYYQRASFSNVESPAGVVTFRVCDESWRPHLGRRAYIKLTVQVAGGVEERLDEAPQVEVAENLSLSITQATVGAAFAGTTYQDGLIDFAQTKPIDVDRIMIHFGTATPFSLSIVRGGVATVLLTQSTPITDVMVTDSFALDVGEKFKLTTSLAGNHLFVVTRLGSSKDRR